MQIISYFPFFKEPFCPHYTDSLSTVYYINTGALRAIQSLIMSVVDQDKSMQNQSIYLAVLLKYCMKQKRQKKKKSTKELKKTLHLCLVIKLASDMLVF